MKLPIIPHRRVNKILCLVLFFMALTFLLIGGIYALLGDADMGLLLCVPAAITACFSLFYGLLWAIYARKEQKRQKNWNGRRSCSPDPRSRRSPVTNLFSLVRNSLGLPRADCKRYPPLC